MPEIPAICRNCGLFFGLPNLVVGTGTLTLTNATTRCPRCKSVAEILDGTYQIMGDAVRVLSTSERSADAWQALAAWINEARERQASPEEIKATIKEQAPELSSIVDVLPHTREQFYAAIQALCALIMVLGTVGTLYLANKQLQISTPPQTEAAQCRHEKRKAEAQARRKPKPKSKPKKRAPKRAKR